MGLIYKEKVVVEIEKKKRKFSSNTDWYFDEYTNGYIDALKDILSFIDTLETKEVDFIKEFYIFSEKYKLMDKDIDFSDIEKTASFFFQLGLKTQKEE